MSDCCGGSTVDTAALQGRQRQALLIVLGINIGTFAMMVVASWLSGSSSLLSGTLDNLGDAITYGLSLAVVGASVKAKARVALFKGLLIMGAAAAVALQIAWHLAHPATPVIATMTVAAGLNLAANSVCLYILTPFRHGDVNMSSVWECSRNDVFEGFAVMVAVIGVWLLDSGWPDILVAIALLALFLSSAARVLRSALRDLRPIAAASGGG
jgi:Co/Zn/Cd efflux system component